MSDNSIGDRRMSALKWILQASEFPALVGGILLAGSCSGGGGGGGGGFSLAGSTGSEFVDVDRITGTVSSIAEGGFSGMSLALAFDPGAHLLYGVRPPDELVAIEIGSGSPTLIGPTAFTTGMAFDPSRRVLFAADGAQLSRVNRLTGASTPVGDFGVNIESLAFDTNHQRLFGAGLNSLYEIDPDTGAPSLIDDLGYEIEDMAFDPRTDRLLAIGRENSGFFDSFLLSINPANGLVAQVARLDPSIFVSFETGLTFDTTANLLYATFGCCGVFDTSLVIIVPETGRMSAMGELGFPDVHGLTTDMITGTVYGSDMFSGRLLTIDSSSGEGHLIGPTGMPDLEGLAFDSDTGTLYGTDAVLAELVVIDIQTGVSSAVGPTGVPIHGLAIEPVTGLLFGTDGQQLHVLSKVSGAALAVGTHGITGFMEALEFGPEGKLYGADPTNGALYAIDPATGDAMLVGPTNSGLYGLALRQL